MPDRPLRIEIYLDKVLSALSTISLISIVLVIVVNIFMRFLFNAPLFAAMEICAILAVWLTFSAHGLNFYKDNHFQIDILANKFTGRTKIFHEIILDSLMLLCLFFVGYSGIYTFFHNYSMTLPAMEVSISYTLYLPFVLGCFTYILFIITKYIKILCGRKKI